MRLDNPIRAAAPSWSTQAPNSVSSDRAGPAQFGRWAGTTKVMDRTTSREEPSEGTFGEYLADATFPATREDLAEAAAVARAPEWVLDLISNLDHTAPFQSLSQAWAEAAGPDG